MWNFRRRALLCLLCSSFSLNHARSMNFSVAEFSNREDMARAVRELDDTYFAERRIRVDYVSMVSGSPFVVSSVLRRLFHLERRFATFSRMALSLLCCVSQMGIP